MYLSIKRFIDIVAAFLTLVILGPFMLILIAVLTIANRGTPFFTQPRPGLHGRIFQIIKFKTMNDKKDSNGNLLPDNQRITRAGRFVRKWSLDELPQLVNVIKSDMSIVGPRPLRTHYLSLYSPEQKRRHDVRPGITGWAQVNGRNSISWTEKFELDVWYVENLSVLLDMKILFLTIIRVVSRRGINATDQTTMEPFKGNN